MTKRVAAIDCGTNSIRLLIADLTETDSGVTLTDVHREMRIVRLGQGVDATGRLAPEALDRTWTALSDYAAMIGASQVADVRMTATSATRDAANADEFAEMVRKTLGRDPEVIAGAVEAELSFRGAVGDLPAADGPFLVFDIGGGSTELVVGTANGAVDILGAVSQNIGSVRITERTLHTDPPTKAEIESARAWAREVIGLGLNELGWSVLRQARTIVAVAGTATTVTAGILDLPAYDPPKIHLTRVRPEQIRAQSEKLLTMTRAERASLGYMHPGRADVVGGGSLVFATVAEALVERIGMTELVVSEHDILDGIALSLA